MREYDPIDEFNAWDERQQALESRLPRCSECGEVITDNFCYKIDGEYYCDDCIDCLYRVATPEGEEI